MAHRSRALPRLSSPAAVSEVEPKAARFTGAAVERERPRRTREFGECGELMRWLGSLMAALSLVFVAPAQAAPSLIEGSWASQDGREVTVSAEAPNRFVGTITKEGSAQCARPVGYQLWTAIVPTGPTSFTGQWGWTTSGTCDDLGPWPATFEIVGSLAQTMNACTSYQGRAPVCTPFQRAGTGAPVEQSPIDCSGAAHPYSEQRVGNAIAVGCFRATGPSRFETTGSARIGGITVAPSAGSGRLTIDTAAHSIAASGMRASLDGPGGRLPDFDPSGLPIRRREGALPVGALPKLAGIPLRSHKLAWANGGQSSKLTAGVSWANLPKVLREKIASKVGFGKTPIGDGSLTVTLDNRAGFSLTAVDVKLSDLAIPTRIVPWTLKSVQAKLEQPAPPAPALRWRLQGTLETRAGCPSRPGDRFKCLDVTGVLFLADNGIVGGGAGIDNLDIPLGNLPIKFQGASAELVLDPAPGLAVTGTATVGAPLRGVPRDDLIKMDATLAVQSLATTGENPCATPAKLSGTGTMPPLEVGGGKAKVVTKLCLDLLGTRPAVTEVATNFEAILPFNLASFRGSAGGWYTENAFSISGNGSVTVRRFTAASGSYVISNIAAAACGEVSFVQLGGVWYWGGPGRKLDTCDLTAFTPARQRAGGARASGPSPSTVLVPPRQRAFAIRVLGDGGSPGVRLLGPGGAIADATGAEPVVGKDLITDRDEDDDATTLILHRPAGGAWRIEADRRVTGVQTARVKPKLRIRARVRGTGKTRRLTWRLTPRAGERVRFIERSGGRVRTLKVTRRRSGSVRFRPVRSRSRRARIIATVVDRGVPIKQLTVARFRAPRLARPARPRAVRVRRAGNTLRISWRRTRTTTLVTIRHGRLGGTTVAAPGRHRIVVPGIRRRQHVVVAVQALAADGRRSPRVVKRLRR
jgi:hypothetical protein